MAENLPNILWICTDQQRYDTIAALGNEHIRTPNVDRLCAEGVAFTRTYCQNPVCTPSRASFLTGCYPDRIHVHRNGNAYFPENVPLVTRMLANAGYDCGLAGKLHLAGANMRVEVRPDDGYRVFEWSHHPFPETFWPIEAHGYQRWLAEQGVDWSRAYGARPPDRWQDRKNFQPGIEARYHQTTWCANEAIAFMSEERDGPWLMSVNPFDPHPPLDPPPEYMDRMDVDAMPMPLFRESEMESQLAFSTVDHQTRTPLSPHGYDARAMVAAYYAEIELIDDQVGRMIEALERSGQRDNTIVIFMSDHGEMLGDHGLLLKGCRFYEGAVHVPLVISWPGHFAQGLRSDALVELMDVMPTLIEAAGMAVPDHVQASSLLPILTGEADPHRHRDFVRCDYHDSVCLPEQGHGNMIFDGRHKLIVYHEQEMGELYDLEGDPCEFRNLWQDPGSQGVKLELMKKCLDAVALATDLGTPRMGYY